MHKTGRTLTISAALLGALLLPAVASEAQAGWTHRRTLTIDTTASGANVSGDVKGFPVPVRLDASNFDFSQARPGGADIRFDDAAGAPLPYEIEKWDAAAKQAAIWVRTDVKGNSRQTMTLKWGNPEASPESDGTKVFPKADGWVTAHHLAEKGAAAGYRDSAGNLDGKGVNITGDATAAGVVGNALSLNRARSEYVLLPGSETSGLFNPLPSRGTFSVWSNAKTHPAAYIAMFAKGESGFRIHYFGEGDQTEPCVDVANYDWCPLPSGAYTKVRNNTWYHFVFVLDKPNAYYYINGKLEVGKTDTNAWKTAGAEPVTIGNNEKTAGGNSRKRSFDGLLDEARILSVPKDKNWAKLDFESQKPGSKLLK